MISLTDVVIIALTVYFFVAGWLKGVLRTLIGPISMIVSLIAGQIYFHQTHHMVLSLAILVFGPIILTIVFSIILTLWHKVVDKGESLSPASRLAGGFLNVSWGIALIVFALALVVFIPENIPGLKGFKEGVVNSKSYAFVERWIKNKIPYLPGIENTIAVSQNPEQLEKLQSTTEYHTLFNDEKIQEILSDEETLNQIKDKDFAKLLTNPKIMTLLDDEELLKKLMDFNRILSQKGTLAPPASPEALDAQK